MRHLGKIIICLSLFLAGYLAGTTSPTVTAQAPIMGTNNDGTSWTYYPAPGPGGVGQWNNSKGQSGQIYSTPSMSMGEIQNWGNQGSRRNPC